VRKGLFKLVLTGLVFSVAMATGAASAKDARLPESVTDVALASLPSPARATFDLVRAGGPFPYAKDGVVFGNRERLLPLRTRGYYREYTVKTPGSADRGAKRIVCGGAAMAPDACYYTADHYASFRKIVP
jgi:ribonuclease T1